MVKTSPCSHKLPMQKGIWNEEEDENITTYDSKQGKGMRRNTGKSSRQRWNNEKKADPRHKSFTPQEEELVIKLHSAIGSRWPIIAQQLPGRSENDVKMLWNSKLRKKLSAMGIDPVTHRPFSQILADYGNIGAFPKTRTRFTTSLSRDFKNAVVLNSDHEQSPQNFSLLPESYNSFSTGNAPELSKNHSLDLYSQLQAINLVPTNYAKTDQSTKMPNNFMPNQCAVSSDYNNTVNSQEVSSFSWSDFLLEDAFLPANVNNEEQDSIGLIVLQSDKENGEGNKGFGEDEDHEYNEVLVNNSFEASSSSNGSFVEAMLEIQDEEMFPQLCGFDEEPFITN